MSEHTHNAAPRYSTTPKAPELIMVSDVECDQRRFESSIKRWFSKVVPIQSIADLEQAPWLNSHPYFESYVPVSEHEFAYAFWDHDKLYGIVLYAGNDNHFLNIHTNSEETIELMQMIIARILDECQIR